MSTCGNGHDLSLPAARTPANRCRACMYARQARYGRSEKGRARTKRGNCNYRATYKGQRSSLVHNIRQRISRNEARVAELEAMLNAPS